MLNARRHDELARFVEPRRDYGVAAIVPQSGERIQGIGNARAALEHDPNGAAGEMIGEGSPAWRPPVLSWSLNKLQTFAGRAVEFITRLCAGFVAAPTCAVCGRREAQAKWVIDALGGIHGRCGNCAGLLGGFDDSARTAPRSAAKEWTTWT
jgi:hypothetical protein